MYTLHPSGIPSGFRELFSARPVFYFSAYEYSDDLTADHSDDSTVERVRHPVSGRHTTYPPLPTCVAAVVTPNFSAPWLGALIRAGGNRVPIKWKTVEGAVTSRLDETARSIREGLSQQIIVVTDPMEHVRNVDMISADRHGPVFSLLLDGTSAVGYAINGLPLKTRLCGLILDSVLRRSGVGELASHVSQAWSGDLDGNSRHQASAYRAHFLNIATEGVGDSLGLAARLATGATLLTAPLLDPDSSYNRSVSGAREAFFEGNRWGSPEPFASRTALQFVGKRRLVLDEGHRNSTELVEALRKSAAVHGAMSDWDLFAEGNMNQDQGFVREERDDHVLSLQVADVATGWARSLLVKGYVALREEFRCVIYNGRPIGIQEAAQLDRSIADHHALHVKALRR